MDIADTMTKLRVAWKAGALPDVAHELCRADRSDVTATLIDLHNKGEIDVVTAFANLQRASSNDTDFFLKRHLFEQVLQMLDSPVRAVMDCVLNLYQDPGANRAAGIVVRSFRLYCEKVQQRSDDALRVVENTPDTYAPLLSSILVARSHWDPASSLDAAMRLGGHPASSIRQGAFLALCDLAWPADVPLPPSVASYCELAADVESDDAVLACIASAILTLYRRALLDEQATLQTLTRVLARGQSLTVRASIETFGLYTKDLSRQIRSLLIQQIGRIDTEDLSTLDLIDFGLEHMLKGVDKAGGLRLLDDLVLARNVDIERLDGAARAVQADPALVGVVVVRWLRGGNRQLCSGLSTLLGLSATRDRPLSIDSTELDNATDDEVLFAARKAVGYLFYTPVAAASVVIGLVHLSAGDALRGRLGRLLTEGLLRNYLGKCRDYVMAEETSAAEPARSVLARALQATTSYVDGLSFKTVLLALQPSEAHREAYARHFSNQMEDALRTAREKSFLLQFVSHQVLLHGNRAIAYVHANDGPAQRTEFPLSSHSVSFERPRQEILDPVGLDYMLRVFKYEGHAG